MTLSSLELLTRPGEALVRMGNPASDLVAALDPRGTGDGHTGAVLHLPAPEAATPSRSDAGLSFPSW